MIEKIKSDLIQAVDRCNVMLKSVNNYTKKDVKAAAQKVQILTDLLTFVALPPAPPTKESIKRDIALLNKKIDRKLALFDEWKAMRYNKGVKNKPTIGAYETYSGIKTMRQQISNLELLDSYL